VQQRSGRARNPFGSGVAIVYDALLEAEAARMSRAAAQQMQSAARPQTTQRIAQPMVIVKSINATKPLAPTGKTAR
jgi:hypothetical protein